MNLQLTDAFCRARAGRQNLTLNGLNSIPPERPH